VIKAAVIVFPGSNCDRDVAVAMKQAFAADPIMVWHAETSLPKVDLVVVPGGFSYGDYLRAGAMAGFSPIMREVVAKANGGLPVLGICNGFQILTETGLLPGALMRNANLKFICRTVTCRVEATDQTFNAAYQQGQLVRLPIAHNEGNYYTDDDTLARLNDNNLVAFRYTDEDGSPGPDGNPNGSRDNIAGIYNQAQNVLGLMPHPERAVDIALEGTDGLAMFKSMALALAA
jgi:phosphoribosylformylglycinamidine synthase